MISQILKQRLKQHALKLRESGAIWNQNEEAASICAEAHEADIREAGMEHIAMLLGRYARQKHAVIDAPGEQYALKLQDFYSIVRDDVRQQIPRTEMSIDELHAVADEIEKQSIGLADHANELRAYALQKHLAGGSSARS